MTSAVGAARRPYLDLFARIHLQKIQRDAHFHARLHLLALELADALLEQLAIKVKPDRTDVPALLRPEHVARAADFQIAHRDFKPAAQGRVLLDGANPFARIG